MSRNRKRKVLFEVLELRHLLSADISLVRYFETWDGSPIRSTDPAGITYHPPSGRLLLVDSEIEEMPEFVGNNIFEISTRGDTVYRSIASGNTEPTGIAYSAFDGYFYVTNDDTRLLTRYDANLNTPLASVDTRTATSTATDPEDVAVDPATGTIYVVDGSAGGRQVLVYDSNLVFQYRFSVANQLLDGEGIAFDPVTENLFIVSTPNLGIFEFTTSGQYVQSYDLSELVPQPVTPQGLAFAPTSDPNDAPDVLALYIVDGMIDNSADGRVFETVISRDSEIQSLEARIETGTDDAEERSSGSVALAGGDLVLVSGGGNSAIGLRFTNIDIPRGTTIVDAQVQFTVDDVTSTSTSLLVEGHAVDNAPTYASVKHNISSRERTSSAVSWTPPPWSTVKAATADQRTPNIAAILQEIIDRPGWVANNALALIFTGTGEREAESFEGSVTAAPKLRVQYRQSSTPPNSPPQVSAGSDQTVSIEAMAQLDGTVSDDGLPGPLTTQWSQVSGPGMTTFDNPNAVDTTASFSQSGTYVLRLSAFDGDLISRDDVTIEVTGSTGTTPATLDVRISVGTDDAEERADGAIPIASGALDLVFDGSNQTVGLRFNGIDIPKGATITNAYVQFQVHQATSGTTSLTIQGQEADNAETFSNSRFNVSSRPRTSSSVGWSPAPWTAAGDEGPDQRTANISSIIQHIVDRPGWSSGNSLALFITGSGRRSAKAFEGKAVAAPLLHIEYSVGSPGAMAAPMLAPSEWSSKWAAMPSPLFVAPSQELTSILSDNRLPPAGTDDGTPQDDSWYTNMPVRANQQQASSEELLALFAAFEDFGDGPFWDSWD